eukprot:TRINITY_DN20829_c0_g1_i1.p1 TRINITY_DN20829_c0_g1~~TRINITY_DN20829_c0_g1_i1.p1  ORF type:complete len:449 (+),score=88.39 TRINITY_DN20829_c0_g1_i1:69-1349(+)
MPQWARAARVLAASGGAACAARLAAAPAAAQEAPPVAAVAPAPPAADPDKEGRPDDLVLESWAHCVAKRHYERSLAADSGAQLPGADLGTTPRRHLWRRRTSWIGLDCGDDSFFVSNTRTAIGVADGVGSWHELGVDPAELANGLMQNCKATSEADRALADPKELLSRAWESIRTVGPPGGTTALVATLESEDNTGKPTGRATGKLKVANLGDSGAAIIREDRVVWRARELQHRFGAPYQLSVLPPKAKGGAGEIIADEPEKAWHDAVPVREGDVVCLATDGYFDNCYNSELSMMADKVLNSTGQYGGAVTPWGLWQRNRKPRMYPQDVVKVMVQEASRNANNTEWMSPFARSMYELGIADTPEEAKGGKPDDITVVLARVVRRRDWKQYVGQGGGETNGARGLGPRLEKMINHPNIDLAPRRTWD